jgi:hypothetical protein
MGYPVQKLQSGKISLAVWEAEYKGNISYNYTLSKGYKDKDGNWQDVKIFTITDFHDIIALSTKIIQDHIKVRSESQRAKAVHTQEDSTPSYTQEEFDEVPF